MDKILISACLLGEHCRYDGKEEKNPLVDELNKYFDLVPFCPEVEGGLPTPRIPSEIKSGRVYNKKGENVTKQFNLGAEKALQLCRFLNIHICILKDKSPSCGVYEIYDGTFSGKLKKGQGVTAALLSSLDYWVMSEEDIPELIEKQKKRREIVEERTASIIAKENGEAPAEDASSYERPSYRSHYRKDGEERDHRKPRGERPYGEKRSYGDRKPYGERKSYGDKPYGERKSYGERKPYGEKRPYSSKKPYGERKSYGEGKSYGDRKSYGEKRSYGDKKPYSKGGFKKSYGGSSGYKKSYSSKKNYKKETDD